MTGDAAELNCWLRMSCRHNLTSIGRHCRTHNQNIRVVVLSNARGDPRAFRSRMEQRMGLFHCMGEAGSKTAKTPSTTVGCRGK